MTRRFGRIGRRSISFAGPSGPAPTTTSLSSTSGDRWSGAKILTLNGTNFTPIAQAYVDGVAITTAFVNSTTLTITLPETVLWTNGVKLVSVIDAGGPSNAQAYTVAFPADARFSVQADLGRTMNGSTVQAWADQVGGDAQKNLTQVTAALQPTYSSSSANFNNKAVLNCATNRYLISGTWTAALAQPNTTYICCRTVDAAAVRVVLAGTGAASQSLYSLATSGNITADAGAARGAAASWAATTRVVCVVFNGVSSAIYVDRYSTATSSGSAGTNSLTAMTCGANAGGGNPYGGEIREIYIASGAHNVTTREQIVKYLGADSGVTVIA